MNESFIRQQNPYINQNMPPRGLNGPGTGNILLVLFLCCIVFYFTLFRYEI